MYVLSVLKLAPKKVPQFWQPTIIVPIDTNVIPASISFDIFDFRLISILFTIPEVISLHNLFTETYGFHLIIHFLFDLILHYTLNSEP